MKRLIQSVGVEIAGLTLLSCTQQPVPVASSEQLDVEADVQAITSLLERNAVLLSTRDLGGWIDQFTDDAVFMPQDHAVVRGRKAGREFARPWYENFDAEFDITVDEVGVHGEWAFARWSFTSRTTPAGGGGTIVRSGKEIWIFERQIDLSWKCSHIIYNYDSPTPGVVEDAQQQEGEVTDG